MQTVSTSIGWNVIVVVVVVVIALVAPSHQQLQRTNNTGVNKTNFYETARKLLLEGDTETLMRSADNLVKSVPYFQASIPMRIFECIREFSILRCTKLFVLQKMEERQHYPDSGNLTKDFLDQFFGEEEQMSSLISEKYTKMSETELHQRLVVNFQRFFKNRDIKLHFLPGIMVKIVPSKENKLKFMLKKKTKPQRDYVSGRSKTLDSDNTRIGDADADVDKEKGDTKQGGGGLGIGGIVGGIKQRRKNKKQSAYKNAIIQMAVPVMVMPAILMGTFLPFILPMLKMATIMTLMMNNSAFIAALIYAARTHANAQDEQQQHISYGHPAYH